MNLINFDESDESDESGKSPSLRCIVRLKCIESYCVRLTNYLPRYLGRYLLVT